jgi:hypothetical protein
VFDGATIRFVVLCSAVFFCFWSVVLSLVAIIFLVVSVVFFLSFSLLLSLSLSLSLFRLRVPSFLSSSLVSSFLIVLSCVSLGAPFFDFSSGFLSQFALALRFVVRAGRGRCLGFWYREGRTSAVGETRKSGFTPFKKPSHSARPYIACHYLLVLKLIHSSDCLCRLLQGSR